MFKTDQRCWHKEYGYVKYNRPLVEVGCSYVEKRGEKNLVKVLTSDLFAEKPPKPTKEERERKRFNDRLSVFLSSEWAYRVAGWMASNETRFNISHPPRQREMIPDILIQYQVDVEDAAITEATDRTDNWSCRVSTQRFPFVDEFMNETQVLVGDYFHDTSRATIQQREFVLGFLGRELGFVFNAEWLNRQQDRPQEFESIRSKVPVEFLHYFDLGVNIRPVSFATAG